MRIMEIVPFGSKQIQYVIYEPSTLSMMVYYYTGKVIVYHAVPADEFQALQHAGNKYDFFVDMIRTKSVEA